jgi:hypothetical protein
VSAASLADWGEAVSFAVMACAPVGGLFLLLVDADLADFDPRPAVRRLLARQGAVHARNDLNWVAASVWHEVRPAAAYTVAAAHTAAATARLSAANCAVALLLLVAPHTPETHR